MIDTDGKLYIGRQWSLESGETEDKALFYDPDDLTTHGVVVGMTGSGKTGLCIDMLEEAALQSVPALMIDPKGDITNTLLHFPDLLPEDFAPWINVDEARRDGKTVDEAAEDTADLWRNGLDSWGIQGDRIQALKDSAAFAIYTPGSDAGLSISILASLAAPKIPWDENRELLREQIASTVTALLGLIGLTDIDPVSSREHVLLANIFEQAWSAGKDLDLGELIMQIQSPPFDKVGFLQTDAFFPEKERFGLAAKINNLVASPSFQDNQTRGRPAWNGPLWFPLPIPSCSEKECRIQTDIQGGDPSVLSPSDLVLFSAHPWHGDDPSSSDQGYEVQ